MENSKCSHTNTDSRAVCAHCGLEIDVSRIPVTDSAAKMMHLYVITGSLCLIALVAIAMSAGYMLGVRQSSAQDTPFQSQTAYADMPVYTLATSSESSVDGRTSGLVHDIERQGVKLADHEKQIREITTQLAELARLQKEHSIRQATWKMEVATALGRVTDRQQSLASAQDDFYRDLTGDNPNTKMGRHRNSIYFAQSWFVDAQRALVNAMKPTTSELQAH